MPGAQYYLWCGRSPTPSQGHIRTEVVLDSPPTFVPPSLQPEGWEPDLGDQAEGGGQPESLAPIASWKILVHLLLSKCFLSP